MKKFFSLLLALCLVFGFAAVSAHAADDSRVIVDALGREVTIPAEVKTIAPLGNAARLCVYLQVQDRFVTITPSDFGDSKFMAYSWGNREVWSQLPIGASGGYGVFHPEVLLEADPDVILCTYEADIVKDIEEQTGLPVVAVAQGTLFGEDYEQSLRIFAQVCGVEQRAEELIEYLNGCLEDLNQRTRDIAEEDKPLVLGAAATFRGFHGIQGVYVDSPVFAVVNANDAAVGLEKQSFDTGVEVDKEIILDWDPDILFLDSGNLNLVTAEYGEDPGFFEQLKAVENGQVYQYPNSTANYTNVEVPLANAYYIGSILCPEAFADVDFEAKAEEIFSFFLGRDGYLDALTESGLGYANIVLGG